MPALSHKLLRQAIAAHLGQVLTPEVAASIEFASFDSEYRGYRPENFETREYGDHVFRVERVVDILDELHKLHELHFAETEVHMQGIALNPDYDFVLEMERAARLIQFTSRKKDTNELVGNIRMYVQQSVHTKTLCAEEDTLYIHPEHRRGFHAVRFMQYAEDCLKSIGVREVQTDSKTLNKAHRLVEYLGYTHVANKYVKIFPG